MPLHPLFASRLSIFEDETLSFEEQLAAFNAPLSEYASPEVETIDLEIVGGEHKIPARLYWPKNNEPNLPGLVWFHGGGFTEGGLWQNESDVVSRELAHRANLIVLAVDYRLCNNGILFPAPQEDGVSSLQWMAKNAEKLGIDKSRIFIGGISAGGALAASVTVQDRDSGNNFLAGALLNCPILHHKLPELSEELQGKLQEIHGFGLTSEYVDKRNEYLCGGNTAGSPKWWFAGEVEDLKGLAPIQIINCEYDALRASGERFAKQLSAAGAELEVLFEPGTPHAHINRFPQDCPPMDRTLNSMVGFIQNH